MFDRLQDLLNLTLRDWDWIPDQMIKEDLSSTSRLLNIIEGKASLYISLGASPLGKEKKGGVWNYGANALFASEAGLILTTLKGAALNLRERSALLTEGVVLTSDAMLYDKIIQSDWRFP